MIYDLKNGNQNFDVAPDGQEVAGKNIEEDFINELSDFLLEIFNIRYTDKKIVKNLMKYALQDKLGKYGRDGRLLQQYHAYYLDEARSYFDELYVPKDIKVNHGYAPHAKFADVIGWIKDNYKYEPGHNKSDSKKAQ